MLLTIGIASLGALAACGGKSTPAQANDELQRDLQLARSQQGLELLPNTSRTQVVSAVEQAGVAEPAPSPRRTRTPIARAKPRRVAPQARVVRTPSPQRQVERPSPRPTYDANVISPPPPGGYKTVDEVIRNAPFPIKP